MKKARAIGPRRRLAELCFDLLYNPIYDVTTARLSPYRRFQESCVGRLHYNDNDRVLCVGVGTGNEIVRILGQNGRTSVVGVDVSAQALKRAARKASGLGRSVELEHMDAQELAFLDQSYDSVLCLHVMGFLNDDGRATAEIMRVLKRGGQFVITYPWGNGLTRLGAEAGQGIWSKLKAGKMGQAAQESVALVAGGLINIPVSWWVKPSGGFYSRQHLEQMFGLLGLSRWQIDEDEVYQEFVVWGTK